MTQSFSLLTELERFQNTHNQYQHFFGIAMSPILIAVVSLLLNGQKMVMPVKNTHF